eukprot:gene33928-45443_t
MTQGVVKMNAVTNAVAETVILVAGPDLEFRPLAIGDATPTAHQIAHAVGCKPPDDAVVMRVLDDGEMELLRPDQDGTIVGQNATGGAVFVNTNDPIINGGTHGYFNANYGNYNDVGAQGAINLPVSDTFAARISLYGERRDGFFHVTGPAGGAYNSHNGDLGMVAGRISLLWKPSENFSILSKTDLGYMNFGGYPASPATDFYQTIPGASAPNPKYHDLFDISANAPMEARDKFVRSILKMEYDTDSGIKFRSITSLQNANIRYGTDLDGTNSPTGAANTYFFDNVTETQPPALHRRQHRMRADLVDQRVDGRVVFALIDDRAQQMRNEIGDTHDAERTFDPKLDATAVLGKQPLRKPAAGQ